MIMRHIGLPLIAVLALTGFACAAGVGARTVDLRITVNRNSVREGGTVVITALITPPKSGTSNSVANTELWPYLNGKQWGAAEKTDRRGRAKFMIPLPNVGTARIQVAARQPLGVIFPVGQPLPAGSPASNIVEVRVLARKFTVPVHRRHLIGIEYEPWFTPLEMTWNTAEAIPLLGKYDSANSSVIRQQALWLDTIGINYILVDWTGNVFGKTDWSQRPQSQRQIIHATTVLLKTYAVMRREGIPAPEVALLLGLDNGPSTMSTTTAINEEMAWIDKHYIKNPRFVRLWLNYRKKPLIVIFNGAGPHVLLGKPPVSLRYFTVRWMGGQLQILSQLARSGYWSWMDGAIAPVPVFNHGKCEALTITPAFFSNGGWLRRSARGRLNGATYLREFHTALKYRPHFLTICQWNEFAGQLTGHSYNPGHHLYEDSYDPSLSNDIEPTSLTAYGYRGSGGWGFYYLNLTRACINLYRQKVPQTTILAIDSPHRGQVVKTPGITVRWACVGKAPTGFTLRLDGKVVARHIPPSRRAYTVDLRGAAPGRNTLTLHADGAVSRFEISYAHESRRLAQPISTVAQLVFILSGKLGSAKH